MVKRTEWIEWWEIWRSGVKKLGDRVDVSALLSADWNERDVHERMVPFVRRGCSWFCVPGKEVVEDEVEEMDEDES